MKNKTLPKLGRPCVGDSRRNQYIKIYVSDEDMIEFEKLEKELQKIYDERGYFYNKPNHFRLFMHNYSNPHVIHFLFENLTSELEKSKKDNNLM